MESNFNFERREGSSVKSKKLSVKFSLEAIEEEKKAEDSEFESTFTPKIVRPHQVQMEKRNMRPQPTLTIQEPTPPRNKENDEVPTSIPTSMHFM